MKYKLQKILNNVKCSRNSEFGKQANQNFITQNLHHGNIAFWRKGKCQNNVKKSNISIYFDFCWVVAHFLGDGGCWWMYCGWWWVVVGCDGYILAGGGGWWWIYFGWWRVVVGGDGCWWIYFGWWWVVVGGCGWVWVVA